MGYSPVKHNKEKLVIHVTETSEFQKNNESQNKG